MAEGDQAVSSTDAATALGILDRAMPTGIYQGTSEGRPCTVEVALDPGERFIVRTYYDADVRADGAIDGPYYKFEFGTGARFVLRAIEEDTSSVYAYAEVKRGMELQTSEKSKVWATFRGAEPFVRIRRNISWFGLGGDDMTCEGLAARGT